MKKKVLLFLLASVLFVFIFAFCVNADYIYKTESGEEIFRFTMDKNNVIESYSGEGFAKTDGENALTWYVSTSTTDGSGNTIKTVKSVKTLDERYFTLSNNGVYSYGGTEGKPVTQYNVVSVNFPYNSGIKKLSLENNGYKRGGYSYDPFGTEILFVYLPNTLTELPERIVQISKAIVCDMPSDAPFKTISHVAFYQAKCLQEINIPSAVQYINSKSINDGLAFYQCVSLKKVTFGENSQLIEIQIEAFKDCSSLSEITLPDNLKTLGYGVFSGTKLVNSPFTENSQCTSIGSACFNNITTLKNFYIPDGITTIGSSQFTNCSALTTISFGSNSKLTTIQDGAFLGCKSLSTVTLPDSLLSVGSKAFMSTALVNSPFTKNSQCTYIGGECFAAITTLKSFIVPNGIEELRIRDFISSFDSLTYIGFGNSPKLKTIKADCMGTKDSSWRLNLYIETIPDTVTRVEDYAFIGTGIVYPFTENSQCEFIGHMAFTGCSSIVTLNIPKNATFVTDLSSYPAGYQKNGVFASCTALKEVKFHKDATVKILPAYMFAYCNLITELVIPNSVTTLSPRLVDRCTSLVTFVMGANVTSINNGRAYSDGHNSLTYGCVSLKYVFLPKTLDLSTGHTDACHVFSTHDYNGTFSQITFFVNGTEAEAKSIQDGFKAVSSCNRNNRINDATIISLKDYNELTSYDKNYIVYGYNTCDAFYGSQHIDTEAFTLGQNMFFDKAVHKITCATCAREIETTVDSLFVSVGYSYSYNAAMQGFKVNRDAFNMYAEFYKESFEYGVIAARFDRMTEENQGYLFSASKYVSIDFTPCDYAVFEIKLSGINGDLADTSVYLCGYASLNGKIYYLNEGVCKENATDFVKSYNQISQGNEALEIK